MAGFSNQTPGVPTLLTGTGAVNFAAGVPGTAGVANDTIVTGVKIQKNAGPATLTFTSGFRNDSNALDTTHYVFTGSTSQDTWVPLNWINSAGPLIAQASVANTCVVETQASGGPL